VDYLLRIDGPADGLRDPVRHYACLKIASEAGVTPRLIYADAASGVAITGFIQTKSQAPKTTNAAVLQSVATAVRDLHAAPLFPPLIDYLKGVDILIRRCQATGILEKRTVEKLLKFYGELAAAYPRRKLDVVSSHNDLNPGNLLFQKNKVWIIDWEAAFAADRYVDLAAITNFFTENEVEREIVLRTYFGAAVTDYQRARLFLMQQANRIFYAMVTFNFAAQTQPGIRLTAADFKSASWGALRGEMAHPAIGGSKIRIACALLHDALREFQSGRFVKAITLVRHPPSNGSRKRR
jgi:thiamine kinase-like enzyme